MAELTLYGIENDTSDGDDDDDVIDFSDIEDENSDEDEDDEDEDDEDDEDVGIQMTKEEFEEKFGSLLGPSVSTAALPITSTLGSQFATLGSISSTPALWQRPSATIQGITNISSTPAPQIRGTISSHISTPPPTLSSNLPATSVLSLPSSVPRTVSTYKSVPQTPIVTSTTTSSTIQPNPQEMTKLWNILSKEVPSKAAVQTIQPTSSNLLSTILANVSLQSISSATPAPSASITRATTPSVSSSIVSFPPPASTPKPAPSLSSVISQPSLGISSLHQVITHGTTTVLPTPYVTAPRKSQTISTIVPSSVAQSTATVRNVTVVAASPAVRTTSSNDAATVAAVSLERAPFTSERQHGQQVQLSQRIKQLGVNDSDGIARIIYSKMQYGAKYDNNTEIEVNDIIRRLSSQQISVPSN